MNAIKSTNLYPKASTSTGTRLAVATSAVSLAQTWLVSDFYALIEIQTSDMYVTFDGTTPSSTNGFKYVAGTREVWAQQRARLAKFIQVSAAGAVMCQPLTD